MEYPAAFKEVMAVASTNPEAEISTFSNTGQGLDVAAPGEKIQTEGFFGCIAVTHGTSIAVPHVVGVASLLWERELTKSNEFIRQLIDFSSKDIANTDDCGLVDANYAMEMYDSFSEGFHDLAAGEERIPENMENPETFSEVNDDETYVEGRWAKKGHLGLIEEGATYAEFKNAKAIAIMKKAVVYMDKSDVNMKGYGNYPEYHGGYKWGEVPVNYVACYEFLTRIAKKGGDTSKFTNYRSIQGLDKRVFDKIKGEISTKHFGDMSWGALLKEYGNTATNRKYYLWGVAFHLLGDSFAHVTRYKSNGVIGDFIKHETDKTGADDVKTYKNRYKVATKAIEWGLYFLLQGVMGDYWEYAEAIDSSFDYTFVKKNLYEYILGNAGNERELTDRGFRIKKLKRASY